MTDPAAMFPCFLDLGPRAVWELCGPDAGRYLNGQVSNDVARLGSGQAIRAYVTDAKGRLQAEVRIVRHLPDAFLVEVPPDLGESLAARLTRYLVADEVEVRDVSGQWRVWHLLDPAGRLPLPQLFGGGSLVVKANRCGVAGHDGWIRADEAASVSARLQEAAAPLVPSTAETLRIRHGIPAWGKELVAGMLVSEAGIDSDAISYTKGCYIGQEVISRVRSAGKLPRMLTRFTLAATLQPAAAAGGALLLPGSETPAGTITSVSPGVEAGAAIRHALGFLSREAAGHQVFDLRGPAGRFPSAAAVVDPT
jgi:folate-binding protein YgfZ